jgi:hypothetical protein
MCGARPELPLGDGLSGNAHHCVLTRLRFLTRIYGRTYPANQGKLHTMALPNKYQNGSIDSAIKGVYRASPVKLMIYGNGSALCS